MLLFVDEAKGFHEAQNYHGDHGRMEMTLVSQKDDEERYLTRSSEDH